MRFCRSGQPKGGKFRRLPMMKISGTCTFHCYSKHANKFCLKLLDSFFYEGNEFAFEISNGYVETIRNWSWNTSKFHAVLINKQLGIIIIKSGSQSDSRIGLQQVYLVNPIKFKNKNPKLYLFIKKKNSPLTWAEWRAPLPECSRTCCHSLKQMNYFSLQASTWFLRNVLANILPKNLELKAQRQNLVFNAGMYWRPQLMCHGQEK
jgi:hypothetical protein